MKRALITGITGQDGLYLAEFLQTQDYQVFGLLRGQNNPKREIVQALLPQVQILEGDLRDLSSLIGALEISDPHEVYNLGAISFVALSWKQANLTGQITGMGVLNMLEAIRIFRRGDWSDVRFYQASSSEMFGRVREIPQTEATPFHPRSPYGSAKAFGHHTTVNYRESYGAFACSGILFNHTSPRRGEEFVTRKISKAAARISLGLQSSISLGNLESKRDWGYAPDYVRAMHAMLQQPEPDDYVIASGSTYSIGDLLDVAFSAVGIADWSPYVKIDERFMRPAEVDLLIGDSSKAQDKLGWNHTLDFQEIIGTIVRSELELAQSKDGAFHAPSASFPRVTRSD